MQPPVDNMESIWSEDERKAVDEQLSASIIGDLSGIKDQIVNLLEKTEANEIMAHTEIF